MRVVLVGYVNAAVVAPALAHAVHNALHGDSRLRAALDARSEARLHPARCRSAARTLHARAPRVSTRRSSCTFARRRTRTHTRTRMSASAAPAAAAADSAAVAAAGGAAGATAAVPSSRRSLSTGSTLLPSCAPPLLPSSSPAAATAGSAAAMPLLLLRFHGRFTPDLLPCSPPPPPPRASERATPVVARRLPPPRAALLAAAATCDGMGVSPDSTLAAPITPFHRTPLRVPAAYREPKLWAASGGTWGTTKRRHTARYHRGAPTFDSRGTHAPASRRARRAHRRAPMPRRL